MVPARNLSKQQQHHQSLLLLHHNDTTTTSNSTYYGNYKKYTEAAECFGLMMSRGAEGYENCSTTESCLGSDLVVGPMAEDESRTNSLNEAAGSSSKDAAQEEIKDQDQDQDQDQDHGWLQLSIGSAGHTAVGSHSHGHSDNKNHHHHHDQILEPTARRGSGLMIELDLLPGGGTSGSRQAAAAAAAARSSSTGGPTFHGQTHGVTNFGSATNNFSTTSLMYFQHPGPGSSTSTSSNFPPIHNHQDLNWAFRPNLIHPSQHNSNHNNNIMSVTSFSSCSSSLMPQLGSYFGRQFQLQPPPVEAAAGPSSDFRVVNPPRRPQSGIWFTLQASQNQAKEPFLPQISKSFLRIRDGRMTVQLLIRYLVNKLRLDSESEIEITCRGQQVQPFLTLQHVRDNIWGPTVTLLPDSSTNDHVMVLHYARSA